MLLGEAGEAARAHARSLAGGESGERGDRRERKRVGRVVGPGYNSWDGVEEGSWVEDILIGRSEWERLVGGLAKDGKADRMGFGGGGGLPLRIPASDPSIYCVASVLSWDVSCCQHQVFTINTVANYGVHNDVYHLSVSCYVSRFPRV